MVRTTPELRNTFVVLRKKGLNKSFIASLLNTTRQTVHRWCKRILKKEGRGSYKDKQRKPKESKITKKVELSILAVRNTFKWGTARIQQGLDSLPKFMRDALSKIKVKLVQGISLSRTAINNVLKKHKLNGYKNKAKSWKFFRAKEPNELWQLDIKGPYRVQGKKYYFVICIDDYSRYVLLAKQLDHCPCLEEIYSLLKPLIKKHKPKKILTDNKPFGKEWGKWCKGNNIKAIFAHPYYPQDKGKVERTIRNIAEEFVYLLRKFPEWLDGKIKEYQRWFNRKRFHRGINTVPAELYV